MTTVNETAKFEMSRTRTWLMMREVFLGSLAMSFTLVQDETIPTMKVSHDTIWYNPDFFLGLTEDQRRFALAHEIMHPAFQHLFRRGHRDAFMWNYAGDIVINELLVQDRIGAIHPNWLYNTDLYNKGGKTTEGVYDLLRDQKGKGKSPKGQPQDEMKEDAATESESREQEQQWRIKVGQAAAQAKMAGKLSANFQRFCDEALKSKVNWREVLREFMTQYIHSDRSWARLSRRFVGQDIYLPAVDKLPALNELIIAFDMSGSIGENEARQFYGEALAICADIHPSKIHALYFDSRVCGDIDSFNSPDEFEFKPRGGGGTAFSPIFHAIGKAELYPACCVVLTDLYCSDFGEAPEYPVLWVSTAAEEAPWGLVVKMDKSEV